MAMPQCLALGGPDVSVTRMASRAGSCSGLVILHDLFDCVFQWSWCSGSGTTVNACMSKSAYEDWKCQSQLHSNAELVHT